MHSHYFGAMLLGLQACSGVASAATLVERQDPASNDTAEAGGDKSKLGGDKFSSKLAVNDGGGANTVVAYADGVCQKKLDPTGPGGDKIQSQFNLTKPWPDVDHFPAQNWNPAKAGESGPAGGWEVFFSIQPAPNCRTIVMTPYSQARPAAAPAPPGNEVINVGSKGCYFARLQDGKELMMTTCCGGACNDTSLGLQDLGGQPTPGSGAVPDPTKSQRRDNLAAEEIAARSKAPEAPVAGSLAARAKQAVTKELTSRYLYPAPKQAAKCSFKSGEPFTQAGDQVVITPFQDCPTSPCQWGKAAAKQFSSTVTFSTTDTITTELGIGTKLEFDAKPLGVGVSSSIDISASISNAIAIATGHDTMNGNSTTFTNTQSNVVGNSAAMTFTPTLTCWTGPVDCGQPNPQPATACTPVNNGGNVEQSGDYGSIVKG